MSDTPTPLNQAQLIEATTEIVSSYVTQNVLGAAELPALIVKVHEALSQLHTPAEEAGVVSPRPAVPIRKSITPDFLICLEDGKKFKSLKRHLRSHFNMTPEEYRAKWGLPGDYPMVASNYAQLRSNMAKSIGLGRKPGASKAVPVKTSASKSTPTARSKKATGARPSAKKAAAQRKK